MCRSLASHIMVISIKAERFWQANIPAYTRGAGMRRHCDCLFYFWERGSHRDTARVSLRTNPSVCGHIAVASRAPSRHAGRRVSLQCSVSVALRVPRRSERDGRSDGTMHGLRNRSAGTAESETENQNGNTPTRRRHPNGKKTLCSGFFADDTFTLKHIFPFSTKLLLFPGFPPGHGVPDHSAAP